mmetsp:Transcript_24323/g.68062  ORF Transcript_24323/g.68062 Transcript_24323/m.68062 type:complete len:226 (-) Transcript_24323:29-706(-)
MQRHRPAAAAQQPGARQRRRAAAGALRFPGAVLRVVSGGAARGGREVRHPRPLHLHTRLPGVHPADDGRRARQALRRAGQRPRHAGGGPRPAGRPGRRPGRPRGSREALAAPGDDSRAVRGAGGQNGATSATGAGRAQPVHGRHGAEGHQGPRRPAGAGDRVPGGEDGLRAGDGEGPAERLTVARPRLAGRACHEPGGLGDVRTSRGVLPPLSRARPSTGGIFIC